MEHLVKVQKPFLADIITMDDLVNLIKSSLASHYSVKYTWDYNDVDMKKYYVDGTLEAYQQEQNINIKKTKNRDDLSIFIDTVKEECDYLCCISICSPIIFVHKTFIECDFDGEEVKRNHYGFENDTLFDFYETEYNYSIEKEIIKKINYQEIVDYVKTHTDEEVIEKYSCDEDNKKDFWSYYV